MPRLVAAELTPLFRERCPARSSSGSASSSNDGSTSSASAEALAAAARFLAARSAARGPVGYLPPAPGSSSSAAGKERHDEAARPEARIRHAERAWIDEAQRIVSAWPPRATARGRRAQASAGGRQEQRRLTSSASCDLQVRLRQPLASICQKGLLV
jgi:hypothetical protein